jgi:hypothetical protein
VVVGSFETKQQTATSRWKITPAEQKGWKICLYCAFCMCACVWCGFARRGGNDDDYADGGRAIGRVGGASGSSVGVRRRDEHIRAGVFHFLLLPGSRSVKSTGTV